MGTALSCRKINASYFRLTAEYDISANVIPLNIEFLFFREIWPQHCEPSRKPVVDGAQIVGTNSQLQENISLEAFNFLRKKLIPRLEIAGYSGTSVSKLVQLVIHDVTLHFSRRQTPLLSTCLDRVSIGRASEVICRYKRG